MRRAFTLIELLVIIGIMGLMVTVGIVNVRSGQGAARTRGAARDVYAAIRHARSTALVTMQPAIVHCTQGIGIWQWASNDAGQEPDAVLACCGETPTLETLAAVTILHQHLPELKILREIPIS